MFSKIKEVWAIFRPPPIPDAVLLGQAQQNMVAVWTRFDRLETRLEVLERSAKLQELASIAQGAKLAALSKRKRRKG